MTVGAITSQSLALQVDQCSQLRQLIFINRIRWDQPLALAAQIVKPFPFATGCTKQSIESSIPSPSLPPKVCSNPVPTCLGQRL